MAWTVLTALVFAFSPSAFDGAVFDAGGFGDPLAPALGAWTNL